MLNQEAPEFATLLRRYRLKAGLSQDALADRAGLSAVTISALERGTRRAPHRQTIALLAGALRLPPSERALLEHAAVFPARPRDRTPRAAPIDGEPQRNTLPLALTSFHGRERDVRELSAVLRERRLVTLWGPGGVGKTRLAVEAAHGMRAQFADGAVLADLAAVSDADRVVTRIAVQLKVAEQPRRSIMDDLTFALRDRQLLLVVDNCEHVLGAVAAAAQRLLQGCAQLRILATSREPLRIPGERIHVVAPLALPKPPAAQLPSLDELRLSPAIRLFLDRALDVTPALTTRSDDERRSLLAICEGLDGMPLAIELAAARTNALGLAALEAQLDDRFRLLTRGERTASARHQTLRATLDWSYSLLAEAERIVFRRVGVFVGGWTLEAAQAVCAEGPDVARADVFDLLGSLVEKSLIVADVSSATPRYRMLETMRAYALERLHESDEGQSVARRHLAHFRRFVERAHESFGAVPLQQWTPPLRVDLDNIRAALHSAFGDGRSPADGVALVAALGWTFGRLSFVAEGQRWCRHALDVLVGFDCADGAKPGSRAIAYDARLEAHLQSAMMLYSYFNADPDESAHEHAKLAGLRAAALYRELGERKELAFTLPWLGWISTKLGQRDSGDELVEEGLAHARALGDRFRLCLGLCWKSLTIEPENVTARHTVLEQALDIAHAIDDAVTVALASHLLGLLTLEVGDAPLARRLLEQGIAAYESAGIMVVAVVGAAGALAWCALAQDDAPAARAAVRKSIVLRQQLTAGESALWSLYSIAGLAVAEGQPRSGAKLIGAAQRTHERSQSPLRLIFDGKPMGEIVLGRLRAALPEHELQALMLEGATWTIERACEEALLI